MLIRLLISPLFEADSGSSTSSDLFCNAFIGHGTADPIGITEYERITASVTRDVAA